MSQFYPPQGGHFCFFINVSRDCSQTCHPPPHLHTRPYPLHRTRPCTIGKNRFSIQLRRKVWIIVVWKLIRVIGKSFERGCKFRPKPLCCRLADPGNKLCMLRELSSQTRMKSNLIFTHFRSLFQSPGLYRTIPYPHPDTPLRAHGLFLPAADPHTGTARN